MRRAVNLEDAIQWLKVAKYAYDRAHAMQEFVKRFFPTISAKYGNDVYDFSIVWFDENRLDMYIELIETEGYAGLQAIGVLLDINIPQVIPSEEVREDD